MRDLASRVRFDAERRVMEIDLTDLALATPEDVAALYDLLDAQVEAAGGRWFFLINYLNCRIEPAAWVSFATRGKRLNVLHSLGTVRYNTVEETGAEIARRADAEAFEANLVANRQAALDKLAALRAAGPAEAPTPCAAAPSTPVAEIEAARSAGDPVFDPRIRFDPAAEIMEADFEGLRFCDSQMVDALYDRIEERIAITGRERWFFLVNYRDCQVFPEAWIAYAHRGKRLNVKHSLGSVRYAASTATADAIAARAARERFDPNLFPSRAAALAKIQEMRGASVV